MKNTLFYCIFNNYIIFPIQSYPMQSKAHADAKGILNLIQHLEAKNVVFVHGNKDKMEIFREVVRE